ncbi:hypothetical protein F4780DRAFT_429520 [Xylariomycetidae sp. FL0641]|nr:hypothetical protein F4780DRAFT_429520 [Xylariomycetidae sp. FL0641]
MASKQEYVDPMDRLAQAPEAAARAILLALCNDTSIQNTAIRHLDRLEATLKENPEAGGTSRKRKAESDIKICVQCLEPFYEEENKDSACSFHDGNLEVDEDSDAWADWDPDCHGEQDTEEMRQDCPQGFKWDCCDGIADSEPCSKGRHEALHGTRGVYRPYKSR